MRETSLSNTPYGSPASASTPVLSPTLVLWLTAGFASLQPLATDLYLPTLPAIASDFQVSSGTVQLTLSVFILVFGCWQLIAGPLSDRFGRHPVIAGGAATFVLSAVVCAMAPSIGWLVFGRALMAAGACTCLVAARGVVRDLYTPAEGARLLAASGTILGCAPMLGPILGGIVLQLFGWRAAFVTLALIAAPLAFLGTVRLSETNAHLNRHALTPGPMLATYLQILRSPTWNAYVWMATASYAAVFAFIAGSAFVLIRGMGVSPTVYGLFFASAVVGYIYGTIWCRQVVLEYGMVRVLSFATLIQMGSGLVMAALAFGGVQHPLALLLPMFGVMFGHGFVQPLSQAGVVARFPRNAGAAAALMGFMMMLVAASVGQVIGSTYDGTTRPLAVTICIAALCSALSVATLVRKHGHVDR